MPWYALRCKVHKEEALWREVGARGYEVYFPFRRVRPVNPRARRQRPFFPGYLFVQTDHASAAGPDLSFVPNAQGLVSFGGEPAVIPEALIAGIRARLDSLNASGESTPDLDGRRANVFKKGESVFVRAGPFSDCQAIFDSYLSDTDRARVLLQFLRAEQLKLVLPVSSVRPTNQH